MKREFNDSVIDALISSAIMPNYLAEPSSAEIAQFITECENTPATEQESKASERLGALLAAKIADKPAPPTPLQSAIVLSMAMNRKNEIDSFSQVTHDAIDEARKFARERLAKEKEELSDD